MAADTGPGRFNKVIFPTDLTNASDSAASYAAMLAEQYGAEVVVVHVVDTSEEAAGFYLPHISYETLDKEMKAEAEKMLESYCAQRFKGVESLTKEIRAGEPYQEILAAIDEHGVDLVVMGTFTKGRLDHFLFGSTTERVMRKTRRPVLVVPPST